MHLAPKNILLIKSHSMGIGDLLRSSAAWSSLKRKWPDAKLYLLMLSKHAGYPSEDLFKSHHLIEKAFFITVKSGHPGLAGQKNIPLSKIYSVIDDCLKLQKIDLVIDFEPYGIKTSLIARRVGQQKNALTVGISQFPLRKYFYNLNAPSAMQYVKNNYLKLPLDYTERDYVVLAALGIHRSGSKINLTVHKDGLEWQAKNSQSNQLTHQRIVTLNIGCGTADALNRRPSIKILSECLVALYKKIPFTLWLTGAEFERDINIEFTEALRALILKSELHCEVIDWSGQCSLNELTGLIAKSDLMISTDSGPYHMAVALGVPTLCWFNFLTPVAVHCQEGVKGLVLPTPKEFSDAALELIHE